MSSDSEMEGEPAEDRGEGETLCEDSDDDLESVSELHQCLTTERMTSEQRQELRERGIVVREGMWTGKEDLILKENMKFICQKYEIKEPRAIMFPDEYPNSAETKKLIQEEKLFIKLCKGIQRPVYNIYIRARKIFDPTNYLGKFSSDEVEEMKVLTRTYGTQWAKIGREMGRSGRSLCDKFKISSHGFATGGWSEEEKKKLIRAVKELTGFNRDRNVERLYFKVPWTAIAERMKTRNVTQCRYQWIDILSWVAAEYTDRETCRRRWNTTDSIRLIENMYKLDVDYEQDIDWLALLDNFPCVPSPHKLSNYWYQLKVRYIPGHHFKSLEENLGLLYNSVLPELRQKIINGASKNIPPECNGTENHSSSEEGDGDERRTADTATRNSGGNPRGEVNAEDHGMAVQADIDRDSVEDTEHASAAHGDSHLCDPNHQSRKEKKKKKRKRQPHQEREQLIQPTTREEDADFQDTQSDGQERVDVFLPYERTHNSIHINSDNGDGGVVEDGPVKHRKKKKKKKKSHHHTADVEESHATAKEDRSSQLTSPNVRIQNATIDDEKTNADSQRKKKRKKGNHHQDKTFKVGYTSTVEGSRQGREMSHVLQNVESTQSATSDSSSATHHVHKKKKKKHHDSITQNIPSDGGDDHGNDRSNEKKKKKKSAGVDPGDYSGTGMESGDRHVKTERLESEVVCQNHQRIDSAFSGGGDDDAGDVSYKKKKKKKKNRDRIGQEDDKNVHVATESQESTSFSQTTKRRHISSGGGDDDVVSDLPHKKKKSKRRHQEKEEFGLHKTGEEREFRPLVRIGGDCSHIENGMRTQNRVSDSAEHEHKKKRKRKKSHHSTEN